MENAVTSEEDSRHRESSHKKPLYTGVRCPQTERSLSEPPIRVQAGLCSGTCGPVPTHGLLSSESGVCTGEPAFWTEGKYARGIMSGLGTDPLKNHFPSTRHPAKVVCSG